MATDPTNCRNPMNGLFHDASDMASKLVFGYLSWSGAVQVVLITVTWPLWFRIGSAGSEFGRFPAVPLVSFAQNCPLWLDFLLGGVWLVANLTQTMVAICVFRRLINGKSTSPRILSVLRVALCVAVISWLASALVNQHRLQAWAYLGAWINVLFLLSARFSPATREDWVAIRNRWRWLILSVYFYSAMSKFDDTFFRTLGSQFLTTGWNSISTEALALETIWPWWLTLMFPMGELIVSIGLAAGRAPRLMVGLAILLHVVLLWLLGPWGMQHQPGVLIWNLFFIGQLGWLFWPALSREETAEYRDNGIARLVLYFALLFPLAQNWGWCDQWMAWELYAPRGSRIQVFVADPAVDNLPDLNSYISQDQSPEFGPLWHELRIDQWSLSQLGAPIYPQDRFQLGVAVAVLNRVSEPDQVLIRWQGPANRWNGSREQKIFYHPSEIDEFARRYFWNYKGNSASRPSP